MLTEMPWIIETGNGKDVPSLERFCSSGDYVVAYFADKFRAGRAGQLLETVKQEADKLLELRIFNKAHEFLLRRSCVGAPFSWRVAAENTLSPEEKKKYCFETRQLLERGESTAGISALPVTGAERYVRLMNYVSYDADGVANAADYRLMGFAEKEAN